MSFTDLLDKYLEAKAEWDAIRGQSYLEYSPGKQAVYDKYDEARIALEAFVRDSRSA